MHIDKADGNAKGKQTAVMLNIRCLFREPQDIRMKRQNKGVRIIFSLHRGDIVESRSDEA